ncbi:MAG TPA: DUF2155 domain-containing protein [Geobacteraceae bacterium]
MQMIRNNRTAAILAVLLTFSLALTLGGCGRKKEEKPAAKPPAPTSQSEEQATKVEVVRGPEKGKWKAVKIGITDREKSRDIIFTVDIGSTLRIPDSGLAIKVDYFLPHFKMNGKKVMSESNKLKNPAAFLEITDDDRKDPATGKSLELKGYLFARYPNPALNHPRYSFVLVDYVPATN